MTSERMPRAGAGTEASGLLDLVVRGERVLVGGEFTPAEVGVQDGVIKTLSLPQYLTFLFFFPTVSSGPIDRYRRFATDWQRRREDG